MTQRYAIGVAAGEPAGSARLRYARVTSWVFLGVAAVLAGVFVLQIITFEGIAPQRPGASGQQPLKDEIVVNAPNISGFDGDGQPYDFSAAAAVQDAEDTHRVWLRSPVGTLRRRSGETLSLAASTALYDPQARLLELDGAVRLRSAQRFEAQMGRARVLLDEKRFRSEVEVIVNFGRGVITAGGMEITDHGSRIVFFNGARAIFRPSAETGDEQP